MAKKPAKITASTTAQAKAPAPARQRVVRHEGEGGIAVYWPDDDTRGLVRIGDLVPGVEYVVDAATARRLVQVKGFRYVTADDEAAAADEPFNDATPDPLPAAATATGRGGIASTSQDQE